MAPTFSSSHTRWPVRTASSTLCTAPKTRAGISLFSQKIIVYCISIFVKTKHISDGFLIQATRPGARYQNAESRLCFLYISLAYLMTKSYSSPDAPIVLLGCQSDRRSSSFPSDSKSGSHPGVPKTDALAAGMAIGASAVMECSAKTGANVRQVFEIVIQLALERRQSRSVGQKHKQEIPRLLPNVFRRDFDIMRGRLARASYRYKVPVLLTMWKNRLLSAASNSTKASQSLHKKLLRNAKDHPEGSLLVAVILLLTATSALAPTAVCVTLSVTLNIIFPFTQ